jgi:hypothetical protein
VIASILRGRVYETDQSGRPSIIELTRRLARRVLFRKRRAGLLRRLAGLCQTPQSGPGDSAALSDEGAALVDAFFAQFGEHYVEPGAYCVPPGMPSTMTSMVSYPIEIIQSPNRLTMLAELEMQVRRICTDGRNFPEDYPPSRMGFSIGHWEGETLVIETALLGEYLMRSWPRTENTRIVERVYRANRNDLNVERNGFPPESESNDLLIVELAVTDATLYKEPQQITMYYQRIPQDEFLEYDCTAGL